MQTLKALCAPHASLCIVGNAKNAGKTTLLNAMVLAHQDMVLGLSSIGLDGEELDAVSFLPKPRVFLRPGCLVAIAEGCLKQSEAGFTVLKRLGIPSALGDIAVARVAQPGNVLLGGPSTARGMRLAMEALREAGAEKLFIDGAFARSSHAMAGEALAYVVGAHAGRDMNRVAERAGLALRAFALPGADAAFAFLLEEGRPGFLDHNLGFQALDFPSALGSADSLLNSIPPDAAWLYLPGALDSKLAERLVKRRDEYSFGLLLQSPLSLVLEDRLLRHLFLLNRPIRVLRPLKTAFVAYNPVSPAGYAYDNKAFLDALSQVTGLPLINAAEVAL